MTLKPLPKRIDIARDTRMTIEQHAYSNLAAEVGGMLFGEILANRTTIIGSVPAANASAQQISLTFTHEVWSDILATGEKIFPGKQIVCWYHTHPSFGMFMSDYDKFIQKNFFQSKGQVGLVIDPIAGTQGWFELNAKGEVTQFALEETSVGPKALVSQPQVKQKKSSTRLITSLLGSILVGGAIGWAVASATSDGVPKAAYSELSQKYFIGESQLAKQQQDYASLCDSYLVQISNSVRVSTQNVANCWVVREGDTWSSLAETAYPALGDLAIPTLRKANRQIKGELTAGEVVFIVAPTSIVVPTPSTQPTSEPSPTASPETTGAPKTSTSRPTPSNSPQLIKP
jgi:proteasome lid subunit RPN8/RPN11